MLTLQRDLRQQEEILQKNESAFAAAHAVNGTADGQSSGGNGAEDGV